MKIFPIFGELGPRYLFRADTEDLLWHFGVQRVFLTGYKAQLATEHVDIPPKTPNLGQKMPYLSQFLSNSAFDFSSDWT